jgi:hypothetical protein
VPFPPPPRIPSGPRRRTLLASAAGAALLVGCSAGAEDGDGTAGSPPPGTRAARARAARDSRALVERYDAVLAAHPALTVRLTPLRAEVVRHLEAFGGRLPAPAGTASPSGAAGTAAASPSAPPTTAVAPPASPSAPPASPVAPPGSSSAPSPADEKAALAALATAEKELADRRAEALVDVDGELARLLASVAAAGAAHAFLLTEAAK